MRSGDKLGESAFRDARRGRLWWVDIPPASRLHWLDPVGGETRTFAMPEMAACVRACRDGRTLIAACHSGLARIDAQTGAFERLHDPEPHKPFNRGNDGATDPRGRFWFGTMQNNVAPDGSDYAIVHESGTLLRYLGASRDQRPMDAGLGAPTSLSIMAGLAPDIHADGQATNSRAKPRSECNPLAFVRPHGVDGRDEPGHDGYLRSNPLSQRLWINDLGYKAAPPGNLPPLGFRRLTF